MTSYGHLLENHADTSLGAVLFGTLLTRKPHNLKLHLYINLEEI